MRLVCPNCDAEYEVDKSMIPPEGRDVQCSNCETTWFQPALDDKSAKADTKAAKDVAGDIGMAAVAKATRAQAENQRSKIDPDALAVIEEEVAFETEARNSDAGAQVDDAAKSDDTVSRIRAIAEDDRKQREATATPEDDPSTKRERLPTVDEINSTLASPPEPEPEQDTASATSNLPARRARGFRFGFSLMLLVAAGALLAYTNANALADRFPEARDYLATYVSKVDVARDWLEINASGMVEKINGLIARLTGET